MIAVILKVWMKIKMEIEIKMKIKKGNIKMKIMVMVVVVITVVFDKNKLIEDINLSLSRLIKLMIQTE